MLHVDCQCGKRLATGEKALGKRAMCPACKGTIRLLCAGGFISEKDFRHRLVITRGPERVGEQLLLGGDRDLGIGSATGRSLPLAGGGVSLSHCKLIRTGKGWMLGDLSDSSPTRVNGEPVAYRPLEDGDVIAVGEYELRYQTSTRPKAATSDPAHAAAALPVSTPLQIRPQPTATAAPAHVYPLGEQVQPPPMSVLPDHTYAWSPYERLAREQQQAQAAPVAPDFIRTATLAAVPLQRLTGGPVCPSCEQSTPPGSLICTDCGINMQTGRPVLLAKGIDEDEVETRVRWLSWLFPAFIYPVASEAYGHARPITVWVIAALTVMISIGFWIYAGSGDRGAGKNLMLWGGDYSQPMLWLTIDDIKITSRDEPDVNALAARLRLSREEKAELQAAIADMKRAEVEEKGTFHWWQLLTHQLLHGDLFHLAGNLLFLLVLGTRVNALLGSAATAILYPILGMAAGVAQLLTGLDEPPCPMLGASGAIMGLAGMYLVLFPVHRLHMAIWVRTLFLGFKLVFTTFAIRGFWIVLAYFAIDAIATIEQAEDGTAHWAHMGGFVAGVGIALALLLFRAVNTHGGDILSVALGKHAWPLIGKPSQWRDSIDDTDPEPVPPTISA